MNATMAISQFYQQGVQFAQAGWMCENMGNLIGAGRSYQQALQAFDACGRLPGAQPLDRLYWVGCCQLRLGWLTYLAGNPLWAQGWFNLAQASLAQVCRLDPQNPTYQGLFQQVQQGSAPAGAKSEGGNQWLGLLKKGLGMLPEIIDLFKGANNHAQGGMGGMGATDWTGGMWGAGNNGWNGGGAWGGW